MQGVHRFRSSIFFEFSIQPWQGEAYREEKCHDSEEDQTDKGHGSSTMQTGKKNGSATITRSKAEAFIHWDIKRNQVDCRVSNRCCQDLWRSSR